MSANVFLKKLRLRNFRSVRDTEITFDNPLFLVGRNGSGKSNVVDAIAFLADCVNLSLKAAMEKRDFLSRGVYIGTDDEWPYVELNVEFSVGGSSEEVADAKGFYHLRLKIVRTKTEHEDGVSVQFNSNYLIDHEECSVEKNGKHYFFRRNDNNFETNITGIKPRLGSQNLALTIVGGIEEFALLADSFAAMRVYHIDHQKIRTVEGVSVSQFLSTNGENIAGVLQHLKQMNGREGLLGINETLGSIGPVEIRFTPISQKDGTFTLLGLQQIESEFGAGYPVAGFSQDYFSDGTLHALGISVALQQDPLPSVVVIEEPENNLHPGALNAISDLIEEASRKTQVIITTHSPDLLDVKWIKPENLRVVVWEDDASRVAELGERPKAALREHLMYAGQLMRANALDPAPAETAEQAADEDPVIVAP